MKPALLLTAVLAGGILWTSAAQATDVGGSRNFGLGFAVGTPTSIVGKYFLNPLNAVDFGLGFSRYGRRCFGSRNVNCGDGYLGVNADYLWHETLARGTAKLDWHIGAGGRMWVFDDNDGGDDIQLAARMPLGLDLTFDRPDFLEVFLELSPALMIVPAVDLQLEALVGVRFYF